MPSSTISIVRLMELEVCAAAEAGDVATVAQRVRPAGAGAGPSSAASASASSSSSSAAPAGPLVNAECTNEVRRQRRQIAPVREAPNACARGPRPPTVSHALARVCQLFPPHASIHNLRLTRHCPHPPVLLQRRLTPLMLAAGNVNAYQVLLVLLQRGALCNATHADSQMSPLHIACAAGNAPAAYALLKAGAHPGAVDGVGRTPLHWAALAGSAVLVRKLLRRSQGGLALLNVQCGSGYSPLMVACEHGREDIVRLLLSYEGCNTVLRNKLNHTAIELADWFGHRALCKLLELRMAAAGQLSAQTQAMLAQQSQQHHQQQQHQQQHQQHQQQKIILGKLLQK